MLMPISFSVLLWVCYPIAANLPSQGAAGMFQTAFHVTYVEETWECPKNTLYITTSATGEMYDFDGGPIEERDLRGLLKRGPDDHDDTALVAIRFLDESTTDSRTIAEVVAQIRKASDPSWDTYLLLK